AGVYKAGAVDVAGRRHILFSGSPVTRYETPAAGLASVNSRAKSPATAKLFTLPAKLREGVGAQPKDRGSNQFRVHILRRVYTFASQTARGAFYREFGTRELRRARGWNTFILPVCQASFLAALTLLGALSRL